MHGLQAPGRASSLARVYAPLLAVAAAVVAVDQISKSIAVSALEDGPVEVIAGAFTFHLTLNAGGAFGLLPGVPGLFLVASVFVVGVILLWVRHVEDRRWLVPLGLVLGGGMGNLADRLFRDTDGRVIDFIDLHVWPVFNLADSAIVVGVAAIFLMGLLTRSEET